MYIFEILMGLQAIAMTVFLFFLNRNYKRMDNLTKDIDRLKNDKIKGMETKLDLHIKEDKENQEILIRVDSAIGHIGNDMRKLTGAMSKLSDGLSNTRETTAKQEAKVDGQGLFISNVNTELQRHKQQPKH